uniref:Uncharacterized protein n=1 Tax=Glossina brevipalpis TaxID=37001 RepID=A0A1A9WPF0_9MUSC
MTVLFKRKKKNGWKGKRRASITSLALAATSSSSAVCEFNFHDKYMCKNSNTSCLGSHNKATTITGSYDFVWNDKGCSPIPCLVSDINDENDYFNLRRGLEEIDIKSFGSN